MLLHLAAAEKAAVPVTDLTLKKSPEYIIGKMMVFCLKQGTGMHKTIISLIYFVTVDKLLRWRRWTYYQYCKVGKVLATRDMTMAFDERGTTWLERGY